MADIGARCKIFLMVLVIVLLCSLVSCVSLPPKLGYNEMRQQMPQLDPQNGRIYIFTGYYPKGRRMPGIKLDDQPISGLENGGFIFADRPAGEHELMASIVFTKQVINLNLKPGQEKFVEINFIAGYPASIQAVVLNQESGMPNVSHRHYAGDWAPNENPSAPPMAQSK
jgi:hypothetical protein